MGAEHKKHKSPAIVTHQARLVQFEAPIRFANQAYLFTLAHRK
jgi:hypothetical protein